MADTYTTRCQFAKPAQGQTGWRTELVANWDAEDAIQALGALAVGFAEIPSASLNIKVAAGYFRKSDGTIVSYAGTSSYALTTAATNYVYLDDAGTLTKSTSAFPTTAGGVRLATCVVGATTITSIADSRIPWASMGGHVLWGIGSPTIAAGTSAGTSPTLTISGSDQGGVLNITTGTSPSTSATLATISFGQAFGSAPRAIILSPANSAAAALSGNAQVYADQASTSTTVFVVKVGSTALGASTAYKWHYAVIG